MDFNAFHESLLYASAYLLYANHCLSNKVSFFLFAFDLHLPKALTRISSCLICTISRNPWGPGTTLASFFFKRLLSQTPDFLLKSVTTSLSEGLTVCSPLVFVVSHTQTPKGVYRHFMAFRESSDCQLKHLITWTTSWEVSTWLGTCVWVFKGI